GAGRRSLPTASGASEGLSFDLPSSSPAFPIEAAQFSHVDVVPTQQKLTQSSNLRLVNVVTRYSHFPIYWIDESAVYCVVWLTFIGASAMTRLRLDFAVTMMTERLSARNQKIAKVMATGMVVLFGVALIATCLLWMDPIGLARAGFDARK